MKVQERKFDTTSIMLHLYDSCIKQLQAPAIIQVQAKLRDSSEKHAIYKQPSGAAANRQCDYASKHQGPGSAFAVHAMPPTCRSISISARVASSRRAPLLLIVSSPVVFCSMEHTSPSSSSSSLHVAIHPCWIVDPSIDNRRPAGHLFTARSGPRAHDEKKPPENERGYCSFSSEKTCLFLTDRSVVYACDMTALWASLLALFLFVGELLYSTNGIKESLAGRGCSDAFPFTPQSGQCQVPETHICNGNQAAENDVLTCKQLGDINNAWGLYQQINISRPG